MAWETKITPISIPDMAVSVSATRTDDVTGLSKTITIPKAKIETPAQKQAVMDEIWGKYQAELNKKNTVAAFIGDLETQANTNLEGRE